MKDVPVEWRTAFPRQSTVMLDVGRYHHHLKFHFIDRKWNSRDYDERHPDDRQEASRRDSSICAWIREQENNHRHSLGPFSSSSRPVFSLQRDSETFLMTAESTLLITSTAG